MEGLDVKQSISLDAESFHGDNALVKFGVDMSELSEYLENII